MQNRVPVLVGLAALGIGAFAFVARAGEKITYHDQISRIVQQKCQTCHRQNGVGPFPFETYEEVYARRGMIRYVIENNIMPPWFADSIGHWSNDRSLTDGQRDTMLTWIERGAPAGNPNDTPDPRTYAEGWLLGEPDHVVQLSEPFPVPAEGIVDYKYMYVKTEFPEDRWVTAMEILPTNRSLVHHVLITIEPPGRKRGRRAEPGEPVFQSGLESYYSVYVPGFQGNSYPEGSAKLLPAGAHLKFQVHYTPNGVAADDQTRLGFHFADGPPERIVETASAYNTRFKIPAGDPRFVADGAYTFERAGTLLSLLPHLHLRGTAFRFDLIYPDGREVPVLNVPRYDFNWQLTYHFEEPLQVPAGAKLKATAWWDNSEGNPFNPDPSVTVRWGDQTFEEMMIGYFDWIADDEPTSAVTGSSQ